MVILPVFQKGGSGGHRSGTEGLLGMPGDSAPEDFSQIHEFDACHNYKTFVHSRLLSIPGIVALEDEDLK